MLDKALPHEEDKRQNVINCLFENYRIDEIEAWPSKNNNTHVVITIQDEMVIHERITLQAILGSDPTKELLNLARVKATIGDHEACLLLMPKKSAEVRAATPSEN